jgi:hypothetical protein
MPLRLRSTGDKANQRKDEHKIKMHKISKKKISKKKISKKKKEV